MLAASCWLTWKVHCSFVSDIIHRLGLGPGKVFVDLGSGVGNCVLQAALQCVSVSAPITCHSNSVSFSLVLTELVVIRMESNSIPLWPRSHLFNNGNSPPAFECGASLLVVSLYAKVILWKAWRCLSGSAKQTLYLSTIISSALTVSFWVAYILNVAIDDFAPNPC